MVGLSFSHFLFSQNCEKQYSKPITALYFISSEGDYIGQGKLKSFRSDSNTQFSVSNEKNHLRISIKESRSSGDYWNLDLSAPKELDLSPGIYKNCQRNSFHEPQYPGLEFSGSGRGCNRLGGEFEILEIILDDAGKVKTFAANFVQKCDSGSPLFGSVRINSRIPVEAVFSDILKGSMDSIVYVKKRNAITNQTTGPILITSKEVEIDFVSLPYGGKGVEVLIHGTKGLWALDFAAPIGRDFCLGTYENLIRYPWNGFLNAGVDVVTPRGIYKDPQGSFTVLEFEPGENGEFEVLAIDFKIENEDGEIIEGSIRHKSKIPVDLGALDI